MVENGHEALGPRIGLLYLQQTNDLLEVRNRCESTAMGRINWLSHRQQTGFFPR